MVHESAQHLARVAMLIVSFVFAVGMVSCRRSPDVEAKARTIAQLGMLRAGLAEFKSRHQRYPSSEEGLSVLSAGAEPIVRGDVEPDVYGIDGWSRAFVYRADAKGITLYSLGPNGIDESGSGDDIRVEPLD